MNIQKWMDTMQLKLKPGKTEYIQFISTKHIEKLDTSQFNANGDLIEPSTVIRYLGGYLTKSLTFRIMQKKKNRKAMANIIKIKSIKKFSLRMQPQIYSLCFAYLTWITQMQCSTTYQKKHYTSTKLFRTSVPRYH